MSVIAPDNEVLIEFTSVLVLATLLLKLLMSFNAPDNDPLRLFNPVTVPDKVLLMFAISKIVLEIFPAKINRPGTVGADAVPDKSPASWILPKLIVVASGVVLDKTLLST